MSNLGMYQVMTTYSKKVGGPLNFMGILYSSGIATGVSVAWGVYTMIKKGKAATEKRHKLIRAAIVYKVHTEGRSKEGLLFTENDTFRVIDADGNAVLIEKIGDPGNPYFVSGRFLEEISDYKCTA